MHPNLRYRKRDTTFPTLMMQPNLVSPLSFLRLFYAGSHIRQNSFVVEELPLFRFRAVQAGKRVHVTLPLVPIVT